MTNRPVEDRASVAGRDVEGHRRRRACEMERGGLYVRRAGAHVNVEVARLHDALQAGPDECEVVHREGELDGLRLAGSEADPARIA